jgi:23S rRNA (adenine2503-C2)-methyltransferase
MNDKKENIRNHSLLELQQLFKTFDEKSFRAKQVYEWLWKKDASTFEEMSNLSK